jgi:membrane associated rhomboid family serine protease
MPHLRHIAGLVALVLLVAYFGVWRGYQVMSLHFGPAWGMAAALAVFTGLIVIVIAGCIVIRTMRSTESGAGAAAKKAKNQPR